MAVLEGFNPNKFIDNLLRIYCKQYNLDPIEWSFAEEQEGQKKDNRKVEKAQYGSN